MNNSKTGYVFEQIYLDHNLEGHPESAKRLNSIYSKLENDIIFSRLLKINARSATKEELILCHSSDYIERVERVCKNGGGYLDQDTYTNTHTFHAATIAVGGLISLTKAVIENKIKNGIALVRPPGHHALAENGMGFCIFGNVAIASKAAIKNFNIKKAAIVDIDVHHGNGTQELIGNNPNILFISTHQYPFYPGTGAIKEMGTNEAKGTIINIPLQPHTNDESFKIIYEEIIIPALKKFKPEIIFVSAGYDSHWMDPLANMGLSLNGYSWISKKLVETAEEICSGKIVFTLEGGYNLDILATGVLNSIKSMMGEINFEDPFSLSTHQSPDLSELVNQLKQIHSL